MQVYAEIVPEQHYNCHNEQSEATFVIHDYVDPNEPSGQIFSAKDLIVSAKHLRESVDSKRFYFPTHSIRLFWYLSELKEGSEKEDSYSTSITSPEDMIASIRSALSLQIKELAEIIHVKRQAIYSWINDESVPSQTNSLRLNQIHQLAQYWRKHYSLPVGKKIRQPWDDNHSLIDLLKENVIDESEVIRRFEEIAKTLSQQDDQDGHGFRHLIKKHGLDEKRVSGDRDLFDALIGKGFSPE
tara:strand:- start:198 stop:923 length:726 start_codon:yes stop_codon:yes gene_type:complete